MATQDRDRNSNIRYSSRMLLVQKTPLGNACSTKTLTPGRNFAVHIPGVSYEQRKVRPYDPFCCQSDCVGNCREERRKYPGEELRQPRGCHSSADTGKSPRPERTRNPDGCLSSSTVTGRSWWRAGLGWWGQPHPPFRHTVNGLLLSSRDLQVPRQ